MERALELASESGVGVVFVQQSNWFGTGAWFVEQAAKAGMLGVAASNSFPKVTAHGGRSPVFGTNPLAFGVPRPDGRNVLFDMATSSVAGSSLRDYAQRRHQLDPGVAIDKMGRPTRDPTEALMGSLLPAAGAKGYGLALLVEILTGVLSGAGFSHQVNSMYAKDGPGKNGHFFAAVDIERIMGADDFHRRMTQLVDILRHSGPESGPRVRLPGEVRWERYADAEANGVPIGAATVSALTELSRGLGVRFP
jgi:LDH2 family malate/lactate/ureidoglycolate dehydrogenase